MSDHVSLRPPLVEGNKSCTDVTNDVCAPMERMPSVAWWIGFLAAASAMTFGFACIGYQLKYGIGTWGLNNTIGWAFDITNFVFWIGIGHAGTLISAILFLFRQKWRTSINRSAEAMTIFAVACAGIFPIIHMGRPWVGAYWLLPYPNFRGSLWVNFRSPLLWDLFAISTYLTISLVFWYLGLVPDLATLRDRAKPGVRRFLLGIASLGWNGSNRTWSRYEVVYLLLAGLATPLVVSVHTIVSFDFATSVIPGWHTTILPPYFVIGAVFSGFAMVLTLMIVARKVLSFENYITVNHIDSMCKIVLLTGNLVGFAYITELFIAWYSGNPTEQFVFMNRLLGNYNYGFILMVLCNVLAPQILWFRSARRNVAVVFVLSIVINIGMWFERYVIIMVSLSKSYLPSTWMDYAPTWIELGTLLGSFGLFFTLFLLFCRILPMISIGEVKGVLSTGRGGSQ